MIPNMILNIIVGQLDLHHQKVVTKQFTSFDASFKLMDERITRLKNQLSSNSTCTSDGYGINTMKQLIHTYHQEKVSPILLTHAAEKTKINTRCDGIEKTQEMMATSFTTISKTQALSDAKLDQILAGIRSMPNKSSAS